MRVIPTRVGKAVKAFAGQETNTGHPHASGESQTSQPVTGAGGGSSPREWGKQKAPSTSVRSKRVIPTRVGKAVVYGGYGAGWSGHPHASGESAELGINLDDLDGSSPREWGKQYNALCHTNWERVIPTRVGKAPGLWQTHPVQPGHPHASGESLVAWADAPGGPGSSPREWGKLRTDNATPTVIRVIPTRVGKACRFEADATSETGHPHASGESAWYAHRDDGADGSSPREWGKLHPNKIPRLSKRVIPTRVGKAAIGKIEANTDTGHPHASGESGPCRFTCESYCGSSPREWGKLPRGDRWGSHGRVIPTRVGKALDSLCGTTFAPGHPHASGESRRQWASYRFNIGSSPREWGKPRRWSWTPAFCRVIPTRVGKAQTEMRVWWDTAGHPHASGESCFALRNCSLISGSSPREWGKRRALVLGRGFARVIPTRVGKASRGS
mgnify:CR=1 FL=1